MKNIISENNETYTILTLSNAKELKLRHPKGRDLRFAMSGGTSESELIFKLASNLTCLSEAELDELDIKDATLIIKEVSHFLA